MLKRSEDFNYQRVTEKISGYATAYNCINLGIPFEQSIRSFLGVCDEVVVVDGESDDGTYDKLLELQKEYGEEKLQIYQNKFDLEEPGIDGLQKTFARYLCQYPILLQFDLDELLHEKDYEKWRLITKRFPKEVDILHLPVVELWGDVQHFTGRRHSWKWRLSRNKPEIVHGINKHAQLVNEKTGKTYAKKNMSDGCEYIDTMSKEMLPHNGFYLQNRQIEMMRVAAPEQYEAIMNEVFNVLPSVWHTSWLSIPNKVKQLQPGGIWDKLWSLLYQEEAQNRFPGVDFSDVSQVNSLIERLYSQGGEDSDELKYKCRLNMSAPKLLQDWWNVQTSVEKEMK